MSSPLSTICAQLGLDQSAIAAAVLRKPDEVEAALKSEGAAGVIDELLKLLQVQLSIKTRRWGVSIAINAIDARYWNAEWRTSCGLLVAPRTRGELRILLAELRGRKLSFGDVVNELENNLIPTASGLTDWHRSTVLQSMKNGAKDGDTPIKPNDDVWRRWRLRATAEIISRICPLDPLAQARYEIASEWVGDQIQITARQSMPVFLADGANQHIASLTALTGAWALIQ